MRTPARERGRVREVSKLLPLKEACEGGAAAGGTLISLQSATRLARLSGYDYELPLAADEM